MGNFTPVSVPEKPASLVSARQVSNVVLPPSCGRSLLVHAIGATPKRIFISYTQPLLLLAFALLGVRFAHRLALAHRRHADVPPCVARRPRYRIGLDDHDVRAISRLGSIERLLELADGVDGLGFSAHGGGMLGEIHTDRARGE